MHMLTTLQTQFDRFLMATYRGTATPLTELAFAGAFVFGVLLIAATPVLGISYATTSIISVGALVVAAVVGMIGTSRIVHAGANV